MNFTIETGKHKCSKTCKVLGCWHHTKGGAPAEQDGQAIFHEALAERALEKAAVDWKSTWNDGR